MRYADAKLDDWIQRLGDIFFRRNNAPTIDELRDQYLSPTETHFAQSDTCFNFVGVPIVFGTAVAEAADLNLGLFFLDCNGILMSPKSFFESLVFTTAQHSAIRQQGGMVAGILLQLFFVSRLAFSFFMCASSSSCSAHPCRYRQIISKVRFVGWLPV